MKDVCVAFKAHLGWVNAVAVHSGSRRLAPQWVERVDLIDSDDRAVREPYHVAGGWDGLSRVPAPKDPAAVIAHGRRVQVEQATVALRGLRQRLRDAGLTWRQAIVLLGSGHMPDELEKILSSHAQIHVAEGEAVRDALRAAINSLRIKRVEVYEKEVLGLAGKKLKVSNADEFAKSYKPESGKWAKEERVLGLAAWLNR